MGIEIIIRKLMKERGISVKEIVFSNYVTAANSTIYGFLQGRNITLSTFLEICKTLNLDIEGFIANGGKPKVIDGLDLRSSAMQFLVEANIEDLIEFKHEIARRLQWKGIKSTWEAREVIINGYVAASPPLKALAADEDLWRAYRPMPDELKESESRITKHRGKRRSTEEYLILLTKIRAEFKKTKEK